MELSGFVLVLIPFEIVPVLSPTRESKDHRRSGDWPSLLQTTTKLLPVGHRGIALPGGREGVDLKLHLLIWMEKGRNPLI